jgi:hypothetical protein
MDGVLGVCRTQDEEPTHARHIRHSQGQEPRWSGVRVAVHLGKKLPALRSRRWPSRSSLLIGAPHLAAPPWAKSGVPGAKEAMPPAPGAARTRR